MRVWRIEEPNYVELTIGITFAPYRDYLTVCRNKAFHELGWGISAGEQFQTAWVWRCYDGVAVKLSINGRLMSKR